MERGRGGASAAAACDTRRRLAGITSATVRGLLVVLPLLDVLGQTFFLAEFLEATEHLLRTLTAASLDSNGHTWVAPSADPWGKRSITAEFALKGKA